jgi:hypothetical protein
MTTLSGIITPTNLVTATGTQTLSNKTLTAPNLITGLTLAGATGTNGQVLTSAGAGLPTWSTPSAVTVPAGAQIYTALNFGGF